MGFSHNTRSANLRSRACKKCRSGSDKAQMLNQSIITYTASVAMPH